MVLVLRAALIACALSAISRKARSLRASLRRAPAGIETGATRPVAQS
jgi:hypothetical protein